MSQKALSIYLKDIEEAYRKGNATEHTYRSYFKTLIETAAPHVIATNEPKHIKNCGAPDFIITAQQTPLGYVETKDIGISLSNVEHTDQMKRYLAGLANLILTDYVEFRWYVTGQHRTTARLAKPSKKGKWIVDANGIEQVYHLMQGFITTQAPTVNNPKELATRMASIAQLIRNAISLSFKSETGAGSLHGQFEGFRQVLLPDLTAEQFADMYAQTICYGLFAARVNTPPKTSFRRELAAYDIPKTNPFLRKMFGYIAGPDLDERVVWAVDDLAEVLNRTDTEAILKDFGRRTRQEDSIVHFYETFLAEYDPAMREKRGVYYTPEPVVSYIVRSVDHLLKTTFQLSDGLADTSVIPSRTMNGKIVPETHRVQILDPATGTSTFLHSVIDLIHESFTGNQGMWSSYVSRHLLPRLFGLELLMAPYAVAHMKLGLQLKDTGYDFKSNERLRIYLTNTLEESYEHRQLLFAEWLVEEATAAGHAKHDVPVMVVLGNPPYSGHSANTGEWIKELLHGKDIQTGKPTGNYFEVEGKPLGEKNPKWLNDDYVKFIRFAQWRIEHTGDGILAFISNNGYLDNPTFRGMRQALLKTFDDIYILDLHGNSKKKEHSPDGSPDQNVFDIQQGVTIGIFVKHLEYKQGYATVRHAHLWGLREAKYHALLNNDIATTQWMTLAPQSPFYFFTPQDTNLWKEYEKGWKITEIMEVNSIGMNSHRDSFAIAFDAPTLETRVRDLVSTRLSDAEIASKYELTNTSDFNLSRARNALRKVEKLDQVIVPCLYRPFDYRAVLYHTEILDRPRTELNHHFIHQDNLGLVTTRQTREPFAALAVNKVCGQHKIVATYDGSSVFPVYLYPDRNKKGLFDTNESSNALGGRFPNLAPSFISVLTDHLNLEFIPDGKGDLQKTFGPEDTFNFIYAIFYSPSYRTRYAEFLKTDFPRLPLTSNADLFRQLCKLGERLVGLHLMERYGTALPMYPEEGNNKVEKVEYRAVKDQPGRVYINKTQYFEGVSSEVWNFYVGGYQVCHKWLKDRKERALSYEDIKHYQRMVAALAETIILMEQIDEAIEDQGGWPIE